MENYDFLCAGAWDGFHVYISLKLKSYFSFKKRYTMTNLGLISYNKRFLYAAVGVLGSTHDARLFRHTSLYKAIISGRAIPDCQLKLGDFGNVSFFYYWGQRFPKVCLLLKSDNEKTTHPQRYFNKKLCSAWVVTENAYGMLKGRWRILHKKLKWELSTWITLSWCV